MRKQTEILLATKRPHLYHQSILNGLGIPSDTQAPSADKNDRFRWDYKDSNFFECGEGWMPIIAAFAESLDHFISEHEIVASESEPSAEETTIVIKGAVSHQHRLFIIIAPSSSYNDEMLSKISALQEFAVAMSGFICEVCGTPVKEIELNSRVQCAVCTCRSA